VTDCGFEDTRVKMLRGMKLLLLVCVAFGCHVGVIDCRLERSAHSASILENGHESRLQHGLRSDKQTGVPAPGQKADLVTFEMTLQIDHARFLELQSNYSDAMADLLRLDPTQIGFKETDPADEENAVGRLNLAVSITCLSNTGNIVAYEVRDEKINARLQDAGLPTVSLSSTPPAVGKIVMPKAQSSTPPPVIEESDVDEAKGGGNWGKRNKNIVIALACISAAAVLVGSYLVLLKVRERKRKQQLLLQRCSSHALEVQEMIVSTSHTFSREESVETAAEETVVTKEILSQPTKSGDSHIITISCPIKSNVLTTAPTPIANTAPSAHTQPKSANSSADSTEPESESMKPWTSQELFGTPRALARSVKMSADQEKSSMEGRLHENPAAIVPGSPASPASPASQNSPTIVPMMEGNVKEDVVMDGGWLESKMYNDPPGASDASDSQRNLFENPQRNSSSSGSFRR